ncbi:MAG: MarC family protein [Candidatus Bathyarchaeia archaeon]
MISELEFVILAITSITAVVQPTSTIAVYITLTRDLTESERRQIVKRSMSVAFGVLVFFAITGQLLFSIFNITIAAFQIAGGILLASVALRMLHTRRGEYSQAELKNIAIVPLAFPLTSGPGSITIVILLVSQAETLLYTFFVFVGIAVGISVAYLSMRYSSKISQFISDEGLRVVNQLMAIIVLSIAVQFVINGIAAAIPQIVQ